MTEAVGRRAGTERGGGGGVVSGQVNGGEIKGGGVVNVCGDEA